MRVNDKLVLDAGTCEKVSGPDGRERLIHPPETTLFYQVLAYLRAKPDPPKRPSGSMVGREGVAAAALVLQWGSYLAVLLDHDKPVWSEVTSPSTSRISVEEMARINIEASVALADWIKLYRSDPGGRLYTQLVDRAVAYLPMPGKAPTLKVTEFGALADPAMAERVIQVAEASRLEPLRADAERHPSRVLANALVNTAWSNGPVENVHAGSFQGYPLDQRRVSPAEERELMGFVSERPAFGMTVCLQLAMERPRRSWPEQVLPCGLAVQKRSCLIRLGPSRAPRFLSGLLDQRRLISRPANADTADRSRIPWPSESGRGSAASPRLPAGSGVRPRPILRRRLGLLTTVPLAIFPNHHAGWLRSWPHQGLPPTSRL